MNMKELEEQRNDLQNQMEEILNNAKKEERAVNQDEAGKFAELEAKIKDIDNTMEMEEKVRNMDKKEIVEEKKVSQEEMEVRAFENYIRNTVNERAAATNLVAGTTGAVIPKTIANRILSKVYDICPILERSSKYNVKGDLELPYYDESTSAITVAYATEFTSLTSNAGEFKTVELKGYLAGALTLVSNSLINNSQFNIVDFVVNEMAKAVARFIEGELLKGTTSKVAGLSGVTNTITAASATAVTADEVIKLRDKVKDAYQANAMWIMSPDTRTTLRLLKDSNGRYLLQDDITAPFGQTLLGKPVYVSDNMEDMAAGKAAIYYGDMSCLATKFSEEMNIQVARERYIDMHATGVIAWIEFDAKVVDTQGIAQLKMKATA